MHVSASGAGRAGPGAGAIAAPARPRHRADPEGYSGSVRVGCMGLVVSARAGACPNLPQRPRLGRSAREETLIFRASAHRRSRPGAPLWQIWTRPHPGSPQEPHQHHAEKNNPPGAAAGTVGRAVARLGEVHDVGAGADTGEAGGRRPGGHPVRPRRPRKSASAGPAQAPRPTRSPLNPRERLLEVRSRGLPGDLADHDADPPPPRTTARRIIFPGPRTTTPSEKAR